jgi:N6-L-threonylcarbamoyladenine synthase
MLCLGIESTAHTLGVGIVRDGKVLANEKSMLFEYGIHPRKTADHHADVFPDVMRAALDKAGVTLSNIDIVAFSQGPGIGPCLRISAAAARAIGAIFKKPIFGVNHCVAHIEISKYATGLEDPLVLYVSGGNTQVIVRKGKKYHVLGETLDIGIGNMLDVFARDLGNRGVKRDGDKVKNARDIELLALKAKKYIPLPYTVKGMDTSFSGILTHAQRLVGKETAEDLCFSMQETGYASLCEVTERALALTGKKQVIVCGGVAQNKRLQGMVQEMAKEWKCKFGVAPNEFNADNGAMIAYVGTLMGRKRSLPLQKCVPIQKYRTDEFEI